MHRADQAPLVPVLEKLRRAIRERRRVRMVYRSRSQPAPRVREVDPYALVHRWGWWYVVGHCHLEREVDPYALVHRWGWWYVVGHCHLREAPRTFRVDRVVEMMLLDDSFDVPAAFDVQEYLASEPHTQPQIAVRLRFSPEAALVARDDQDFWDAVEERSDGSVVVSFGVPSLEWAAQQVLYYGPQVTVLEPEELRDLVQARAGAIGALYAGPNLATTAEHEQSDVRPEGSDV
jgi:predicted DNA-binding transcriptional regulator YafY